MPTTIQVKESTLDLLKKLRESTDSKNYDEVIIKLASRRPMKSMAGALAGGKRYSTKDILKGLRDDRGEDKF